MQRFKGLALAGAAVLAAYLAGAYVRKGEAPPSSHGHEAIAGAAAKVEAADQDSVETVQTGYVCPMHSHVTSDHEGECPICGMDLVPQVLASSSAAEAGESGSEAEQGAPMAHEDHEEAPAEALPKSKTPKPKGLSGAAVRIEPGVQQNLGVRVSHATRGDMHRVVQTVGKITRVDSTARNIVSSPLAGKIEFIVEKDDGDSVQEGELLFTVASAELNEQQRSYQEATKAGSAEEATMLAQTLMDQGLTAEQIAQLQQGAEPNLTASFYAPKDSFVFFRRGAIGEEVTPGFTVFNLGGNKRLVEVTAEIFEQQWGWVQEGQDAEMVMRGLPGKVFAGKVVRVDPPVGFTTRTLEVRIEFETDDEGVAQNVFGRITIKGNPRSNVVIVPSEAVIRTEAGERVVTVRKDGAFQSVPVVAGEDANGMTEIITGLRGGEAIVTSGQFLIDSESSRVADLARLSKSARSASKATADAGHHRH